MARTRNICTLFIASTDAPRLLVRNYLIFSIQYQSVDLCKIQKDPCPAHRQQSFLSPNIVLVLFICYTAWAIPI